MADTAEEAHTLDTDPIDPLVVQCLKCREVLGDSTNFVCKNQRLQTLTLNGVSNVDLKEKAVVVDNPGLEDEWVSWLGCCGTLVGQQFLTTPERMETMSSADARRDMFTFNVSAICSYELGQPEMRCGVAAEVVPEPPVDLVRQLPPGGEGLVAATSDAEKVLQLETQMLKVQNMLLLFNERIEKLETGGVSTSAQPQGESEAHLEALAAPAVPEPDSERAQQSRQNLSARENAGGRKKRHRV